MASSPLPSWLPVPGLPKELAMEISPAASNDPTAGMTPEQIASYTSRIGGESSDVFHQVVGVGINLSILAFAVLGASYVVLSLAKFVLDNQIRDELKAYLKQVVQSGKSSTVLETALREKVFTERELGIGSSFSPSPPSPSSSSSQSQGSSSEGSSNRESRRLRSRLNRSNKEK
eukprot:gene7911-8728_t